MYTTFYRILTVSFIGCFLLLSVYLPANARPQLVKSLETLMEIPNIKTVSASEAHLFVLSEREGMIVFRNTADSLQWLYTSSGLADRGDQLVSDIRFSYLFGKDRRLTVIEPTSILGVYSSTELPSNPNDLVRIDNDLFIADNEYGIQKLSLETHETVDQTPESVFRHDQPIISIAAIRDQLFALDRQNRLFHFEYNDGELDRSGDNQLPRNAQKLHSMGNRMYVTTSNGDVHRVRTDGRTDELFGIDESVSRLKRWNSYYLIQGESSRIWIARQGLRPTLFRDDPDASNHFSTFKNQLWISDYNQFSRWIDTELIATYNDGESSEQTSTRSISETVDEAIRIASIDNQVVPYPRPLIIPLSLESGHNPRDVQFQQISNVDGIRIRGNSLYWQPSSSHVGTHAITVIAGSQGGRSDSTSFSVTVRQFNSPPRFSPVRPLSIAVNEDFSIPFQANDPDGSDAELIRYIGVDLPDGASLDEQSGTFEWTPSRRQSGEHEFQVIATDQYGAASSIDVKIKVVDLSRGGS